MYRHTNFFHNTLSTETGPTARLEAKGRRQEVSTPLRAHTRTTILQKQPVQEVTCTHVSRDLGRRSSLSLSPLSLSLSLPTPPSLPSCPPALPFTPTIPQARCASTAVAVQAMLHSVLLRARAALVCSSSDCCRAGYSRGCMHFDAYSAQRLYGR